MLAYSSEHEKNRYEINRNISSIQYNSLNLPSVIQFGDNSYIEYTYSASGEKLRVTYGVRQQPVLSPAGAGTSQYSVSEEPDASGAGKDAAVPGLWPMDMNTVVYCGNMVYDRGERRLLTDEGYVTFAADGTPQYHFYLRDHLGNIRVVFDQTGAVEQVTHYYPFGGVMRESTNPGLQPYKYGGKELDRTSGLDAYDFGARMYFADRLQWGQMDPLCEKYYDVSPYGYCKNKPFNLIDPDGRKVIPVYYKDNKKPVYYHSPEKFKEAMLSFAKTSFGKQILSDFTPKGSWIFGVKGNGKYAQFDLMIYEFEFTDVQAHTSFWFDSHDNKIIISQTQLNKDETGKPQFSILFDINYSENELTESITHEFTVHLTDYKSVLDSYIKSGNYFDAKMQWNKYSQDYEHYDLIHNKQLESSKNYYKTKNELIRKNPALNQVFTNRLKEYE